MIKTIVLQKCKRLFNDIPNDDIFMNDLINNNNKFIDNMTRIINNYYKKSLVYFKKYYKEFLITSIILSECSCFFHKKCSASSIKT